MIYEVFESGSRRAEIKGNMVFFQKITGKVRKSTVGIWKMEEPNIIRARSLAKRWAFKRKLGKPVLH